MNALINVTTNEQGLQVVSARELHGFLQAKKQFADWIKNRIEKYGLIENQDYTTFSLIGEKGRPSIEYALTLDCGKELAMVEGNTKGKEARLYFIECEKQMKSQQVAPLPLTPMELLVQQMQGLLVIGQEMVNVQRDLVEVKADLQEIKQIQQSAASELLALPAPTEEMAEMATETKVRRIVNTYASATVTPIPDVWNKLYLELLYRYKISVNAYKRPERESKLQMLKRLGHLDKLYVVATNILQVQQPT